MKRGCLGKQRIWFPYVVTEIRTWVISYVLSLSITADAIAGLICCETLEQKQAVTTVHSNSLPLCVYPINFKYPSNTMYAADYMWQL